MKSWTKLAKIVKVKKNWDFVVQFTTRSFFVSNCLDKLHGHTVCLLPPLLDINRFFVIDNICRQGDRICVSLLLSCEKSKDLVFKKASPNVSAQDFVGKYLFISNEDAKEVFSDISKLEIMENQIIGMQVIDYELGIIGIVKKIGGGDRQKHMVVTCDNESQIIIPYVKEIVKSIDECVVVDCPKGLIDLNSNVKINTEHND